MGTNDNEKDHVCGDNCDCGHEHGHDCDCGHDHGEGHQTVTLTMEDDTEMECAVLGTFDLDDKEYIAMVPVDSDEAFIYRFKEDADGEIELSAIEDDEEFQKASAAFYEIFSDEYDDEEFEYDEDFEYEEDLEEEIDD